MMTIYDIAREVGAASSTVSRVVNGKVGVKEETRQRILALLEKYHYSSDAAARGRVKQPKKVVGILDRGYPRQGDSTSSGFHAGEGEESSSYRMSKERVIADAAFLREGSRGWKSR